MSEAAAKWLATFPEATHATVRSWFAYAITNGARTPDAILMVVVRLVGHKLDWAVIPETRQLCHNALQALVCDRGGALAYAAQVLKAGQP
jgi:hypothetical protein